MLALNKWLMNKIEDPRNHIYVIELSELRDRVVFSLFTNFLIDLRGNELPNGQFRMLGKVVRKISGPYLQDLLEKSSLNAIDDRRIEQLFQEYSHIEKIGLKLPK